MKNKRKGMSLIVLVITILVMLILAGVVIVSLSDNNPILKATESKFKTVVSEYKSELEITHAQNIGIEMGYDKDGQNVLFKDVTTGTNEEKEKVHLKNIKKFIPDMTLEYSKKFDIVNGLLQYRGNNKDEVIWAGELDTTNFIPLSTFAKSVSGNVREAFNSVIKTKDGGYIAIGQTSSDSLGLGGSINGNNYQQRNDKIMVVKYDKDANEVWKKGFGSAPSYQYGYKIVELTDGNYAVVGYGWLEETPLFKGEHDIIAIKISPSGDLIWEKSFGGNGDESSVPTCIATTDGGMLIGSSTNTSNFTPEYNIAGYDAMIIKVDSNGVEQFRKAYGASSVMVSSCVESADSYSLLMTVEGNIKDYVFKGGTYDAVICKIDKTNGNLIKVTGYNTAAMEMAKALQKCANGDYIFSNSASTVTRVDSNFNLKWAKKLDFSAEQVAECADLNIIATGFYNGIKVTKLSQTGDIRIPTKSYAGSGNNNSIVDMIVDSDNGPVIVGYTNSKDIPGVVINGVSFTINGREQVYGGGYIIKLNKDLERK